MQVCDKQELIADINDRIDPRYPKILTTNKVLKAIVPLNTLSHKTPPKRTPRSGRHSPCMTHSSSETWYTYSYPILTTQSPTTQVYTTHPTGDGQIEMFNIRDQTALMADTLTDSSLQRVGINGLLISIDRKLIVDSAGSVDDQTFFPFYAFANVIDTEGTHPCISFIVTQTHNIGIVTLHKFDIELLGPRCPNGSRLTHVEQFRDQFDYIDKDHCPHCQKEYIPRIDKRILHPKCKVLRQLRNTNSHLLTNHLNRIPDACKMHHASKKKTRRPICNGNSPMTAATKGCDCIPHNTTHLIMIMTNRNKATFMMDYTKPVTRLSQPVKRVTPSFTLTNPHSPTTREILTKRKVIQTPITLHTIRTIVSLTPTYPTTLIHITGVHRWDQCTKCITPSEEKGTQYWEIEPLPQKEEEEVGDMTQPQL